MKYMCSMQHVRGPPFFLGPGWERGLRLTAPWLLVFQVVLPAWLSSTKVSSLIERISDPKDLKKLLRTRNNVLVLYSKSGECSIWPWGHPLGMGWDKKGSRGGRQRT